MKRTNGIGRWVSASRHLAALLTTLCLAVLLLPSARAALPANTQLVVTANSADVTKLAGIGIGVEEFAAGKFALTSTNGLEDMVKLVSRREGVDPSNADDINGLLNLNGYFSGASRVESVGRSLGLAFINMERAYDSAYTVESRMRTSTVLDGQNGAYHVWMHPSAGFLPYVTPTYIEDVTNGVDIFRDPFQGYLDHFQSVTGSAELHAYSSGGSHSITVLYDAASVTLDEFSYSGNTICNSNCADEITATIPQYFDLAVLPNSDDAYVGVLLAGTPSVYHRFNESQGAQIQDYSGNAAAAVPSPGMHHGIAGALQGSTDTAMGVTGNGQHISLATEPFSGAQPRTVSFWLKMAQAPTGVAQSIYHYGKWGQGNTGGGLAMTPAGQLIWRDWSSGAAQADGLRLDYNSHFAQWTHIAVTYDGTQTRLYLNGNQVGQLAQSLNTVAAGQHLLGMADSALGENSLIGQLDEFALFNRALDANEVHLLHRAASSELANTADLEPFAKAVLEDVPLAYWRFEETEGTNAEDLMGRYPGELKGGVSSIASGALATGSRGISTNGQDAYVQVAGFPTLTGPFTLEAWVRFRDLNGFQTVLSRFDSSATWDRAFFLEYGEGDLRWWTHHYSLSHPETEQIDKWYHLVVTDDGSQTRLFVNGQTVAEQGSSWSFAQDSALFFGYGKNFDGPDSYLSGDLDEIAVYAHALSADRVSAHYTAGLVVSPDAVLITEDLTLLENDPAYTNKDLTIIGATVTADGQQQWKRLRLLEGAVLTHSVGGKALDITADVVEIDATSSIDVQGRGHGGDAFSSTGGSHAGRGGETSNYSDRLAETPYGDYRAPTTFGTGQAGSGGSRNGIGGGAIKVTAQSLTLDGVINADGGTGTASSYRSAHKGGAAAGSVWLDVGALSGSGSISANGTHAGRYSETGGAGGRVAVYFNELNGFDFTSQVAAYGGRGDRLFSTPSIDNTDWGPWHPQGYPEAGVGTIYIKDKGSDSEELRIVGESRGVYRNETPVLGDFSGKLVVHEAFVIIDGNLASDQIELSNSQLSVAGNLTTSLPAHHFKGNRIFVAGQLALADSATDLVIDGWQLGLAGAQEWNSLEITGQGSLSQYWADTAQSAPLVVTAQTIRVETGSSIDVSGRGPQNTELSQVTIGGASHGGLGGTYGEEVSVAPTYGDYRSPVSFGSSSIPATAQETFGSHGGGAVHLIAEHLLLNGAVRADGTNSRTPNVGGSSGGSIWVEVEELQGTGLFSAEGAINEKYGFLHGPGGGGRIAIHYDVLTDFDLVSQSSVAPGNTRYGAQAGSVHFEYRQGPVRILGTQPSGAVGEPISNLLLRFETGVDAASFSPSDIQIEGPDGPIQADSVTQIDPLQYQIGFVEPLREEGIYTFTVGTGLLTEAGNGMDQDGDGTLGEPEEDRFIVNIVLDTQPPAVPVITGLLAYPQVNITRQGNFLLSGTRSADARIFVDGVEQVGVGENSWSAILGLADGEQTLSITAVDAAGNVSDPVWVSLLVDTIAPALSSPSPGNNRATNTVPGEFRIRLTEAGSGLDLNNSSLSMTSNGSVVAGRWHDETSGYLTFVPDSPFTEAQYHAQMQLVDQAGNQASVYTSQFSIDLTSPTPPTVDAYPAVVNYNEIQLTGTREEGLSVYLRRQGSSLSPASYPESTTWKQRWSRIVLVEGENIFEIFSRDAAGNYSEMVTFTITYDNTPPGPVTTSADGDLDGASLVLDWSGYDLAANGGDIDRFDIYAQTSPFSSVDGLTSTQNVAADQTSAVVAGLDSGTTYYLAVVAVDAGGLFTSDATPVTATPQDVQAPLDAEQLTVSEVTETSLTLNWVAPQAQAEDMVGYTLLVNEVEYAALSADTTRLPLTGLNSASELRFKLQSRDEQGNISAGAELRAATIVPNPVMTSEALDGGVTLSWTGVATPELLARYEIHRATVPFTQIGQTRVSFDVQSVAADAQNITIENLDNGRVYYFALVAVNISEAYQSTVIPLEVMPQPDSVGPVISDVRFEGQSIQQGATLSVNGTVDFLVTDDNSVQTLSATLAGRSLSVLDQGQHRFAVHLDLLALSDGNHTLSLSATDEFGNETTLNFALVINLAAPSDAPSVTAPEDGAVVGDPELIVTGQAGVGEQVLILLDGSAVAGPLDTDADGGFLTTVTLNEGAHQLAAVARNRGGDSLSSAPITVDYVPGIPPAPSGLRATLQGQGVVVLTWVLVNASHPVKGFHLYRSTQAFTSVAQADRLNTRAFDATSFQDLLPGPGVYYYRVVAENEQGVLGGLSNLVRVTTDLTPPTAEIRYQTDGVFDDASGRFGPGTVQVTLSTSETLATTPFLILTPETGTPIFVDLNKTAALTWTGSLEITTDTPTGTAWAVFSGRDAVGNRGSEITLGESIEIDTRGPVVTNIEVDPQVPWLVDPVSGLPVGATLTFDEAVADGQLPQVSYLLSGDGRAITEVTNLTQLTATQWQASFTLPEDAGSAGVEQLSFQIRAEDDMGNLSFAVDTTNLFELYQGDLAPLGPPQGITGKPVSGGRIQLTWEAQAGASDYQVYRQAPGESEMTPLTLTGGANVYIDSTSSDDAHRYVATSLRQANGQTAESAQSSQVVVSSDSVPPPPPTGLTMTLTGAGILGEWERPIDNDILTYRLYRGPGLGLDSIEGLTPILDELKKREVLDSQPSETESAYAVTAVDKAGNESGISGSVYLNPGLLPVATLKVARTDDQAPVLSWSYSGSRNVSFDVYLGGLQSTRKINPTPLSVNEYVDSGYRGDDRLYRVEAVDQNGIRSLPRTLLLPALDILLPEGQSLQRGVMNRLRFQIENRGERDLTGLVFKVSVAGRDHDTTPFNIRAGQTLDVPVAIGGYPEITDSTVLQTQLTLQPHPGEEVRVERQFGSPGSITEGVTPLLASITVETLQRGLPAKLRFGLENNGQDPVQLLTATGRKSSNQILIDLLDMDDNLIKTVSYRQVLGDSVVNVGDKSLVTVAPGERFESDLITLPVPLNAPDQIRLRVRLTKIHYHYGQPDAVQLPELSSSQVFSLIEPDYGGVVTTLSDEQLYSGDSVLIQGSSVATDPITGAQKARPDSALRLIIRNGRIERSLLIQTDGNGAFRHEYKIPLGESGLHRVSLVHPGDPLRPVDATFQVVHLSMSSNEHELKVSEGVYVDFPITVGTGKGTSASQVRLQLLDTPVGLNVELPEPVDLAPEHRTTLIVRAQATADLAQDSLLHIQLLSDERGETPWSDLTLPVRLQLPSPRLAFSTDRIETSVNPGDRISETFTIRNDGAVAARDLRFSVKNLAGGRAPAWFKLDSTGELEELPAGQDQTVQITLAPEITVEPGDYEFQILLKAHEHDNLTIPVFVTVTNAVQGNVLFKLADIYTATRDKQTGELIEGVEGAKIFLERDDDPSTNFDFTSDEAGEVFASDLPKGRYRYHITATDREEKTGLIRIRPGITINQYLFLNAILVRYEWSVVEIPLEDRYEVRLGIVYQTDVPAPVLLLEPRNVVLPPMQPGDIYQGELTVKNVGLVRLDDLYVNFGGQNDYYRWEMLADYPDSLEAHSQASIPYRVIGLAGLDLAADGEAGGGGSTCGGFDGRAGGGFVCANGDPGSSGCEGANHSGSSCSGNGAGGYSKSHYRSHDHDHDNAVDHFDNYGDGGITTSQGCQPPPDCQDNSCDDQKKGDNDKQRGSDRPKMPKPDCPRAQ